jgi:hypothetical protein
MSPSCVMVDDEDFLHLERLCHRSQRPHQSTPHAMWIIT